MMIDKSLVKRLASQTGLQRCIDDEYLLRGDWVRYAERFAMLCFDAGWLERDRLLVQGEDEEEESAEPPVDKPPVDKPPVDEPPVGEHPLEWLEISNRPLNCLEAAGIGTITQLLQLSPRDIRSMPNMGTKSYNEIIDALMYRGLKLKEESA